MFVSIIAIKHAVYFEDIAVGIGTFDDQPGAAVSLAVSRATLKFVTRAVEAQYDLGYRQRKQIPFPLLHPLHCRAITLFLLRYTPYGAFPDCPTFACEIDDGLILESLGTSITTKVSVYHQNTLPNMKGLDGEAGNI